MSRRRASRGYTWPLGQNRTLSAPALPRRRYRHRDRGYAGTQSVMAQTAGSQGGGALRRAHRRAGSKWRKILRKGSRQAGNARVRRGMIQLAWRFIRFQLDSALAKWFYARTADGRKKTRKTMIVALARKLLIALWRLVTTGEVPTGVMLRAA